MTPRLTSSPTSEAVLPESFSPSNQLVVRTRHLAKGGSSNGAGGELGVDLLPGTPQLLLNHGHCHLAIKAGHLHGPCVNPHGVAYPQLQHNWAMPDTALGHAPRDALSRGTAMRRDPDACQSTLTLLAAALTKQLQGPSDNSNRSAAPKGGNADGVIGKRQLVIVIMSHLHKLHDHAIICKV
ncbi:MAG: hypothetical protein FRX49_01499 [Trebouxia sp. A1-2]|nr:MAG: hypothetical protein FRX49_01499 [Trebouxia sp. A1-2]